MKKSIAIISLVALSACVTQEELTAAWTEKCSSYGFKAGTEAFSTCLMTKEKEYNDRQTAVMLNSANNLPTYTPSTSTYKPAIEPYKPVFHGSQSYGGYGLRRY